MLEIIRRLADWLKGTRFSKTKVGRFTIDVLIELLGVTWPNQEEVKSSTLVTVITLVVVAVYLWMVGLVLYQGITFMRIHIPMG